jgi:hypothetical protein
VSCCGDSSHKKTTTDGVKGNFAFLNGIMAPDELAAERRATCDKCDRNKLGLCVECGCVIKLKTALLATFCPLSKWSIPQEYVAEAESRAQKEV